jgi:TRAP-type C4-dicarboxylate transport system permease small subunit
MAVTAADLLRRVDRAWLAVERAFLASALLAMVAMICGDFLGRELFGRGIAWAKEAASFLMIWVGFIGASVAAAGGRHLRIEALDRLLPPATARRLYRATHLLAAGITAFLAYLGLRYCLESYGFDERSAVLDLPLGLVQAVIPIALLTTALRLARGRSTATASEPRT